MEAYLESLYGSFPRRIIQTYIIYKVEFFDEEYGEVFQRFPECVVIREGDFHGDFMRILNEAATKYILFGIDDVVYFDSIDFDVIDGAFAVDNTNIFGFSLRFGRETIEEGGDPIHEKTVKGQTLYAVDWARGRTALIGPHCRGSGDLHLPAGAALAVNDLASAACPHARPEADPPPPPAVGDPAWVMHSSPRRSRPGRPADGPTG